MTNMSYCRFQNTKEDLLDCEEHLDDELEGEEKEARIDLINICKRIVDDYGDDEE